MNSFSDTALGWNAHFAEQFSQILIPEAFPGRVAVQHKTQYLVLTKRGERQAEITGRLLYAAGSDAELPKVGDWVALTDIDEGKALIHQVLERRTKLSRKVAGRRLEEQVIAANLDVLFIVQGLDDNFNPARLERYLTAVSPEIRPVIVLNKADLRPDAAEQARAVEARIGGVPVVVTSAAGGDLGALQPFLEPGRTVAFVGSSGVGKSSLINGLLGRTALRTSEVRAADSRGRHTTTHRELIPLADGAVLIDTPGMRELQLWGEEASLDAGFADIRALAAQCRYRNCRHQNEPDCAVLAALDDGSLAPGHLENFRKMQREIAFFEAQSDAKRARQHKAETKRQHKIFNRIIRKKGC